MAPEVWSSKRRKTSHEGWESASSAQNKQGLFDEPEQREADRRLERAIMELTLEMLEAVRLSPQQLLHILEHPRCAEYLVGAYVRYPDLEEMENGDVDESEFANIPPLPAQITKLIPRDENQQVVINGETYSVEYDFSIIQYTQRSDGSLKIRKGKMHLPLVQKSPFTEAELQKWQDLLKMFSGRQGYEKLQSLPLILPATAAKLNSFTFTNDDVDLVLKRKFRSAECPYAHIASMNFRNLYLRKSELEVNIKAREDELKETTSDEAIEAINDEIAKLNAELQVVIDYVAQHEKSAMAAEKQSNDKNSYHLEQTSSITEKSWRHFDGVRSPRTLCWRQPMSYLDGVYPLAKQTRNELHDRTKSWSSSIKSSSLSTRFTGSAQVGRRLAIQIDYNRPAASM